MNNRENNAQEQQRLGQLKNLVMLAAADGHLTDSEMAVLLAVASRENIIKGFEKIKYNAREVKDGEQVVTDEEEECPNM